MKRKRQWVIKDNSVQPTPNSEHNLCKLILYVRCNRWNIISLEILKTKKQYMHIYKFSSCRVSRMILVKSRTALVNKNILLLHEHRNVVYPKNKTENMWNSFRLFYPNRHINLTLHRSIDSIFDRCSALDRAELSLMFLENIFQKKLVGFFSKGKDFCFFRSSNKMRKTS